MEATRIGSIRDPRRRFFAYARERHGIWIKRHAGRPYPWTSDPILTRAKFTNVYRELDAVTLWFRHNVREPMSRLREVLPATVLFRWFNRPDVGRVLFLTSGGNVETDAARWTDTPFLAHIKTGDTRELTVPLRRKGPPYVTGAYTINTRGRGTDKMTGVVSLYETFMQKDWKTFAGHLINRPHSMEHVWEWLQTDTSHLGAFMAYEIVCDLRWTRLLERAPDKRTWASAGPGAKRGLLRVLEGREDLTSAHVSMRQEDALRGMRALLEMSDRQQYWPGDRWPQWEMREVEHTLCEFDKYERVRLGQGKTRGVFRP